MKLHRKNRFTLEYTHLLCSFAFQHPHMSISSCSSIFQVPSSLVAARLSHPHRVDASFPYWLLSPALDHIRYISSVTATGSETIRMSINYGDCVQFDCEYSRQQLGLHAALETTPASVAVNNEEGIAEERSFIFKGLRWRKRAGL